MSGTKRTPKLPRAVSLLLSLALVLSLAPLSPAMAAGSTIYVSTSGSDSAAGTASAPLRTIQAAAGRVNAGDTIVVRGGTYAERPNFSRSGTSDAPIVVQPYGTEAVTISQGLVVSGSYNRISGFTITPGTSSGAQVNVTGSNNVLDKLKQRDTYRGGTSAANMSGSYNRMTNIDFSGTGAIVAAGPGTHNTYSGGTIHHTGGMFALADGGHYATFEGLDMHDSGQVDRSDNGADGINLNAHHVTIRNNKLYNIFIWDPIQHVDAIQWWNTADDLVIEGNRFGSKKIGGSMGEGDYGHIQFETYAGRTCQRVIIRNNLFLGTHSYYNIRSSPSQIAVGSADNWQIIGNTFMDGKEIRGDILANMRNTIIRNNVFTTTNRMVKASGSVYDNNAYIGAPKNATDGANTIQLSSIAAAGFVNPDFSAGANYGRSADLHLKSTSPLIGKGATLSALPKDIDGFTRKSPTSIGAYEYGSTSTNPNPTPVPDPTPDPTTTPDPTPNPDPTPDPVGAPTGWFTVNGGAAETISRNVTVKNYVTGATKYRIDTGSGYGAWTPYTETFSVLLPTGYGAKPVAIQYANASGAVHNQATSIKLVLCGSMKIASDATYTKTRTVKLTNGVHGAAEMRFDAGNGYGAWVPFAGTATVTLPAGDGAKTVTAQYRNANGSQVNRPDTIRLDTSAPTGSFTINKGATYTSSRTVYCYSSVKGATKMRVNSGYGYGSWGTYSATKRVNLTYGTGTKRVYIQYKDAAGNTITRTDTIVRR